MSRPALHIVALPDPIELITVQMRAFQNTVNPTVKLSAFSEACRLYRKIRNDEFLPILRDMAEELMQDMRRSRGDPQFQSRCAAAIYKLTQIMEKYCECDATGSKFRIVETAPTGRELSRDFVPVAFRVPGGNAASSGSNGTSGLE